MNSISRSSRSQSRRMRNACRDVTAIEPNSSAGRTPMTPVEPAARNSRRVNQHHGFPYFGTFELDMANSHDNVKEQQPRPSAVVGVSHCPPGEDRIIRGLVAPANVAAIWT